jgi:hypothetical protein
VFRLSAKLFVMAVMLPDCSVATGYGQPPCRVDPRSHMRKAAPTCPDAKMPLCHFRLGQEYLSLKMWNDAQRECSVALDSPALERDAHACVSEAKAELEKLRSARVGVRVKAIEELVQAASFDLAKKELADLQKMRTDTTGKLGPIEEGDEKAIAGVETKLALAMEKEWPRNIRNFFGFREGTPRVVSWTISLLEAIVLVMLAYLVASLVRFLVRRGKFLRLSGPIEWTVSSILDDTKQAAAGALMDALNVDYNPLFQKLPVSSLLAVPVRLLSQPGATDEMTDSSNEEITVWRDFMLLAGEERQFLSTQLEEIDTRKFTQHRFKQAKAFDDFNLKLGIIEAAPGAVVRSLRRWWQEGWPSLSGAVTIERVGAVSFANVRLIGNIGDLRGESGQIAARGKDIRLKDLFSGERTISVFASTQIDQYTDAVALASHRAAFRFLFRLIRPNEPNLAIAASSYRQGLRLLATAL